MQNNPIQPRVRKNARSASASGRPCGRRQRICIVGGGSVSQSPRVVKEADALAAAGYDVVVLFVQHFEWARALDRKILQGARWRANVVDASATARGRCRQLASALQLFLFGRFCGWTMRFPVPELAYSRYFLPLLWRAIRCRGDFYIGHYAASLPVVACAAARNGVKFGFDFEDFHRGETKAGAPGDQSELIAALEDRYLRSAYSITAASRGIAEEVAKAAGIPKPTTVLNVFPWSDRSRLSASRQGQPKAILSLYWFSQIVSLDRGLHDVIGAMALMRNPVELHIRGGDANGSIRVLRRYAQERHVCERVRFYSPVPPAELLAAAAIHDIGLCLEVPATPNRDICVTNKIFLYLLAGLAVVVSRTRGHMDVLNAAPGIGSCYDSGNIVQLAAILDRYAADDALLEDGKAAALAAARERWNWERESRLVINSIDRLFSEPCVEQKTVT